MLTVETEVNVVRQKIQMKGVLSGSFLSWFVGLVVPVQEIVLCLDCLSRPSIKYFFLTVFFFKSCVPIRSPSPSKLGRQPSS